MEHDWPSQTLGVAEPLLMDSPHARLTYRGQASAFHGEAIWFHGWAANTT
jgi:hypothetical protein